MKILAISILVYVWANAGAHVQLAYPPSLSPLDFLDNLRTTGICGEEASGSDNSGLWKLPTTHFTLEDAVDATPILAGQPLNITWNLNYAHQGGWRVELYNSNITLIRTWNDSEHWGCGTDGTQQTASLDIPSDIECEGCILRFQRQALEWGGTYLFHSCAIVDITTDIDECNGCSGNGQCTTGQCSCDTGFYGQYCQYENECEEDTDCGEHGLCIDTQSDTAPAKSCFCKEGWWGPTEMTVGGTPRRVCNVESSLQIGNPDNWTEEYAGRRTSVPDGNMDVFYNIDEVAGEIEFAIKANTRNWVAVGWRPDRNVSAPALPPTTPTPAAAEGEGEGAAEGEGAVEGEGEGVEAGGPTRVCTASNLPEFECMFETSIENVILYWTHNTGDNLTMGAAYPLDGWVGLGFTEGGMIGGKAVIGQSPEGVDPVILAYDLEGYSAAQVVPNPQAVAFDNAVLEVADGATIMRFDVVLPKPFAESQNILAAYHSADELGFHAGGFGVFPINFQEEEYGTNAPELEGEGEGAAAAEGEGDTAAEGEGDTAAEGEGSGGDNTCNEDGPVLVTSDEGIDVEDSTTAPNRRLLAYDMPVLQGEAFSRTLLQEATAASEGGDVASEGEGDGEADGEGEDVASVDVEQVFFGTGACRNPLVPGAAHPMINQDIVVMYARGKAARVVDTFTPSRARPIPDKYFDGTDDIIDAVGEETEDGTTLIKFRRKLLTDDQNGDYCLFPEIRYNMIWAYGQLSPNVTHLPGSSLELYDPATLLNGENFYKQDELKFHGGGISAGSFDGRGSFGLVDFFAEPVADGCTPSDLQGYACMQQIFEGYVLHWSAVDASSTEVDLAAVAQGTGWVGFGLPATPGVMAGSTAIIGWIGAGNASPQIALYDLGGYSPAQVTETTPNTFYTNAEISEENGATTLKFTKAFDDTFSAASANDIIAAFNPTEDAIASHGSSSRSGGVLNFVGAGDDMMVSVQGGEEPQAEPAGCPASERPEFACVSELGAEGAGGWVSFGIPQSPGQMVGSHAVIGDSSGVKLYSLNSRSLSGVVETDENPFNIDLESLSLEDGGIGKLMKFNINLEGSTGRRLLQAASIDPTSALDLLNAGGDEETLTQHSYRGGFNVNFASGASAVAEEDQSYFKAHGWLMVIGWAGFIPLALMVARTLKDQDPFWYYFHIASNSLGLACALVAFIIALVKFETEDHVRHRQLGIAVMVIGLFQPFNAVIRPKHGAGILRTAWEFFHWSSGRAAVVCALWNCFWGIQLYAQRSTIDEEKWMIALGSYIGALAIVYIAMESRAEVLRKEKLQGKYQALELAVKKLNVD